MTDVTRRDLQITTGRYLRGEWPENKQYLRRYFQGHLQQRILAYYFQFPYDVRDRPFPADKAQQRYQKYMGLLQEHTGLFCGRRMIHKTIKELKIIEAVLAAAEKAGDFTTSQSIRTGQASKKSLLATPPGTKGD